MVDGHNWDTFWDEVKNDFLVLSSVKPSVYPEIVAATQDLSWSQLRTQAASPKSTFPRTKTRKKAEKNFLNAVHGEEKKMKNSCEMERLALKLCWNKKLGTVDKAVKRLIKLLPL